jgi:DNA-directed RNA polymerase sigma subunit (sigma70/sigma32)
MTESPPRIELLLRPYINDRELTVLRLRYGLDGERLTQKQIGYRFHITANRVHQIEHKALSRIRWAINHAKLDHEELRELLNV